MKGLTLILILAACAASGCRALKGAEPDNGTGVSSAVAKSAVNEAAHKMASVKVITAKIESKGETSFKQDVQFIAPDRYHVSYIDESGAQTEMIMIGNDSYIKSGDSWAKMEGDISPTPTFRNRFTDEVLQTVSDAEFIGEDVLDGRPVVVYAYNYVKLVGGFQVRQKIWVDTNSGLPIKSSEDYSDGVTKNLTTTYDTETPITIEAPKVN